MVGGEARDPLKAGGAAAGTDSNLRSHDSGPYPKMRIFQTENYFSVIAMVVQSSTLRRA